MPIRPDGPAFGDHSWWASGRPIVPLIMFAILIGVLVWGVLRLSSAKTSPVPDTAAVAGARHDGALEEVRVRYARGEMNREEFMQRFRDLGGTGIDPPPPAA